MNSKKLRSLWLARVAIVLAASCVSGHAATLTITSPLPGQEIPQNGDLTISWDATGNEGPVAKIVPTIVDGDGSETKLPEVPVSAGKVTYRLENWGLSNGDRYQLFDKQIGAKLADGDPGTKCRILLTGYWGYYGPHWFIGETIDVDSGEFTILNPSVAVLGPKSGDIFRVGDVIPFRWKTTALNYPQVALMLSTDGGESWIQTGFYAQDTGGLNLQVARGSNGTLELVIPPDPDDAFPISWVYFGPLQPNRTYSLRIRAGASEGYGEMEGTFAILDSNSAAVRKQTIKCTAGKRLKRRILGVVGKTSMKGKLPSGLKYRTAQRSVVGRPKLPGVRRVQVTDARGTKTLVLFKVRKARVSRPRPPFFFPG